MGGIFKQPHLLKDAQDVGEERFAISEPTVQKITDAMYGVVNETWRHRRSTQTGRHRAQWKIRDRAGDWIFNPAKKWVNRRNLKTTLGCRLCPAPKPRDRGRCSGGRRAASTVALHLAGGSRHHQGLLR